jgi:hypothetical protein
MISFLFIIVVGLKPFRNVGEFPLLIKQHAVISHEQNRFMENLCQQQ